MGDDVAMRPSTRPDLAARVPAFLGWRGPGGRPHPPRHRRPRAAGDLAAGRHAAHHRLLRLRGRDGALRPPGLQPADVGGRRLDDRTALRRRGVRPRPDRLGPLRRPGGDPGGDGRAHRDARQHPAPRVDRRVPLDPHRHRLPVRRGRHHHRPPAAGLLRPAPDRRHQPAPRRLRAHPPQRGQRVVARHRLSGSWPSCSSARASRPPDPGRADRPGRLHGPRRCARPPRLTVSPCWARSRPGRPISG